MRNRWSMLAVAASCVALSVIVSADTLYLRDGTRVDGELVAISGDRVEFEARGRFGGRERMRVDRDQVLRIEFDRRDNRFDFDRDRDRDDRRDNDRDRDRRPSGLREHAVSVDSWVQWNDTGVDVRGGQSVYFAATGRVRWGPDRQDTPKGERNSPRNDARPIPNRPAAALIGKIGDNGDPFFIGDDESAMRMRSSGRLFLGVNDDYLKDNTGSFRVTVYY